MGEWIDRRLRLAREIAVEAGDLAVRLRREQAGSFSRAKSHQDFVTVADLAAETLIRDRITREFPEDSILGEEQGGDGDGASIWVVDPIDGTTNFMRGLADWGVSIAFCQNGSIVFGAIYAPDLSTLVWARAGQGAFLNDTRISVSTCDVAENALVLLGRSARRRSEEYHWLVQRIFQEGMEYRRNGSAAFSLLSVALGRAEGFYEAHLNAWDALAGILITQEAGGSVACPGLAEFLRDGGAVLASNGLLHKSLGEIIDDMTS